jgi:hypothetical protein
MMIGRKKELAFLRNGISPNGTLRCACLTGEKGIGKTNLIKSVREENKENLDKFLWIQPNLETLDDILHLISEMTRGVSHNLLATNGSLKSFARSIGQEVEQFKSKNRIKSFDASELEELGTFFIDKLSNSLLENDVNPGGLTPVLVFDGIDKTDDKILSWLSGAFNQALRKSAFFSNTRFIFASNQLTGRIKEFFSKFGFSSPVEIRVPLFSDEECAEFAKLHSFENLEPHTLKTASSGIPLNLLNIFKNKTILYNEGNNMSDNIDKNNIPTFSDFSEKELNYLLYASYPKKINRYNLEFFCSPRAAAFCYNWLKRQKKLADVNSDGDLSLNEDFRAQMRQFHKQEEPEEAERMSNVATILDAFTDIFPNPSQHWVAVNLQLFDSFTKSLCKKLFDEIEYDEIKSFLNERDDIFNISNQQFSLKDDVRLLCQRFIEIGGGQPKEDLIKNTKSEWLKYKESSAEKRSRLEQEKVNLEEEAFDSEKQIMALDELKSQLLHNYQNPPKQKSKREYSFTSSALLIIIGLGTVGASLFSESLGSYHAACGLAITIFGFFWPNIDIKKQTMQTAGNGPRLAIETQQRSLSHRINGLASRLTSIKSNLDDLNMDLGNLDQGTNSPYIAD